MGVVFLAHDEQLERDVAIKVLPPVPWQTTLPRKRFRQEALSLAKLDLQAATVSLNAVIREAEKRGTPGSLYEARLALAKAQMKNQEDGRAHLAEVEKDAGASGFFLISS